jgi:hypothetical protein
MEPDDDVELVDVALLVVWPLELLPPVLEPCPVKSKPPRRS